MTIRVLNRSTVDALLRVHVRSAFDWSDMSGTDYWLEPGSAVNGATTFLLSNRGWTTTSLGITAGSAADLNKLADPGVPRTVLFNASGDLLTSPFVFGDYAHAKVAAMMMGRPDLPRYLVMDSYAAFTTASSDENTSGFGFVEAGGAITSQGDQLACIVSDSANFKLASGADSDVGAVVDNSYHWWRIVLDALKTGGTGDAVEWFIDGVSQGTIDLETDLFPVGFSAHTLTNNRVALGQTHIFYAWEAETFPVLTT